MALRNVNLVLYIVLYDCFCKVLLLSETALNELWKWCVLDIFGEGDDSLVFTCGVVP